MYQALVESEVGCFNYFGMTERTFKERYYGHVHNLKDRDSNGTALSNKIWQLRDNKKFTIRWRKYTITWSVLDKAYPYRAGAKSCNLCLSVKMHIAMGRRGFKTLPEECVLLNKSEIMRKCRHKLKFTLDKVKEEEDNSEQ